MRILHTMLRVGDLDRSLAFYTEVLGMQQLRRQDYPGGRFTLAFVGFGPESEEAALELASALSDLAGCSSLGIGAPTACLGDPLDPAACQETGEGEP